MNGRRFKFCTLHYRLRVLAILSIGFLVLFGCVSRVPPELVGDSTQAYVFPSAPQLRLNPAMHTAKIHRVDIDKRERFAVTASDDKSVLVWDLDSGQMLKRLRLPAAEVKIGKAYAVAMSPDGEQIAVG